MRIALLDTFYDTSHRYWAEGLLRNMNHDFTLYTNKPKNWKWQMIGGVLNFVEKINESQPYDLIVASDMVNIPLLKSSLTTAHQVTPILVYFHENQITYPWSPNDVDVTKNRDHHYGWINYMSAVLANGLLFNSAFHRHSFLKSLPVFIKMFPKFQVPLSMGKIEQKSSILPIGVELPDTSIEKSEQPIIIWNHRWEYDKNPEEFFKALFQLSDEGREFKLVVVGKEYKNSPAIFQEAKRRLETHILHWGWVESRREYLELLEKSNILLITSNQDFFGISIVEAIAYGCHPILPNRLCYPEHIPKELSADVLYEGYNGMISLLAEVLTNGKFKNTKRFQEYIAKYYWENISSNYNEVFLNAKKTPA
ncbi:MAG: glycosyltransferase involved in cell wall biosynthesis [Saprospiraceae bacterium]|jgi:glycosyltransferase involved in cell wall biosynthesis